MVNMRSTQAFLHCKCNTQLVVFILNEPKLFISRQRYFSFSTKNTFHKSTRKVKTQNNNVFILEQETLFFFKFTFPGKMLISMLTDQNLITVDSEKNRAKTHSVISNVRTRTNRHQMQMLILNRLRLKNPTFLKHCLSATMMCLRQSL